MGEPSSQPYDEKLQNQLRYEHESGRLRNGRSRSPSRRTPTPPRRSRSHNYRRVSRRSRESRSRSPSRSSTRHDRSRSRHYSRSRCRRRRSHSRGHSQNRDRSRNRSGHRRVQDRDHVSRPHRQPSCYRSGNHDREYFSRESWPAIESRLQALETRTQNETSTGLGFANSTEQIVEAIHSLRTVSSQKYYVSNFDPNIHDVDAWFDEVDRAMLVNRWDNRECLSRIGSCLKGEAKNWLDEWVTSDRSWSNFKSDFKSLCVRKIDVANVLFEVMSTNSDTFHTYADYARKSLLRLRIVKGLSDELITAIILRGITDPHVKATATNGNLCPNNLVNYLSTFVKPKNSSLNSRSGPSSVKAHEGYNKAVGNGNKRPFQPNSIVCYSCKQPGHRSNNCRKKSRPYRHDKQTNSNDASKTTDKEQRTYNKPTCTYCKKIGHWADHCFAKRREDQQNTNKVNFCSTPDPKQNDIVVGVIEGIPIDILIDSGAIGVSLISSDVVYYFSCQPKPVSRQIKGVGDSVTHIDSLVTLVVVLDGITLEVDLLVVPKECMNAPIIIGTDVLNREGVTYIRTKYSQRIVHDVSPSKVSAINATESNVKTSLIGDDLITLQQILKEHSSFMISGTATSTVTTGVMQIRVNSDTPIHYRPYKMSLDEKIKVRAIIRELLSKGIIRESESPYASPILLVKKKDGSDRLCIDYRALNRVTIKDRFPLPLIEDHIDRLGKGKYFTILDMATGFHQIRLDEASIPLTGFVTTEGHYEYVKMPYGLANAPIVFQRIISKTLAEFITTGKVLVYIDDCLLISSSIEEGLQLLREVLSSLTKAGFSINLKKCSFLCTEIEYLGRVISNGEVRPSMVKIEALVKSTAPRNVKQVRQFLGLAGYFRRYIANYSTRTACIARLLCKNVEFTWGDEQERVRQEIITILTNEPVLAIFDPELPTEVHTDASSLGYGAILQQVHKDGKRRVVAYYSQVTKGAEQKYHSYELETLAVVKSLKHFRHYLIGIKFTVITDCNALKATQNKKDLLPRVARWWIFLQDYDFVIIYRKGAMLPHADYLSRNPCSVVNNINRPRNWAQIAQAGDEETRTMIQLLEQGQLDSTRYVLRNDVLYYRFTPVGEEARLLCFIPKGHRLSLLRIFHDEHSHINAAKVIDLVLRHFWFPGLRSFVNKYVGHCLTRIAHKRVQRRPLQPITSWEKPNLPFDTLHVDVLGPLPASKGFKYVMLVVDAFTKYCLLTPIARQDVEVLKRVFKYVISLFGTPKLVVSDRGRMFESVNFTSWMQVLGIELHHITPEMHHANGQVERYVRTVLNMLRVAARQEESEWADDMWQLQLILNLTKQKTTQASALDLLIGHESATPAIRMLIRDVGISTTTNRESRLEMLRQRTAERLARNQQQQDADTNKDRRAPRVFKSGDMVFVIKYSQSQGKLDPGMRGPYRVVRALDNDRYELKLVAGSYGKTTYAAAQFLVPWRGEWTPDTCAAFFEDTNDLDSSDNNEIMEQRVSQEAGPSSRADDAAAVPRSMPSLDLSSSDEPDGDVSVSGEAVLEINRGRGGDNTTTTI